jgi:hypothetical protein
MNDVGLRGGDRVAWRIWGIMVECVAWRWKGRRPMDLGKKVADMPTPPKIGGAQHIDPVTHVDGR